MGVKGIIFDLYRTLIDIETDVRSEVAHIGERCAGSCDEEANHLYHPQRPK
jgi:FMN phosphatase YigB (HAD superfamily)